MSTLHIYTVKDIKETSATVHVGAEAIGTPSIAVKVQYKIAGESTWIDTESVTVTHGVLLDFYLTNLMPSQSYEARAVATWGTQSQHTATYAFVTVYVPKDPWVATLTVNSSSNHIMIEAAIMGGPGDFESASMYVQYRKLGSGTWLESSKNTIYSETEYNYRLYPLDHSTTYEVRGAIEFGGYVKYGVTKTATTIAEPSWEHPKLQVVSPPIEILDNSALIEVYADPGDYPEVWVSIEYRVYGGSWLRSSTISFKSPSTKYVRLSNLNPSTGYEYRGRLKYDFIINTPIYSFVTRAKDSPTPPPPSPPPPPPPPLPPDGDDTDGDTNGIPWYLWAIGGVAVVAALAIAIRRK